MGTVIKCNEQDALKTASQYDGVAKDYTNVRTDATDLESHLESWEGEAATACSETILRIEGCLNALSGNVLDHAGAVRSGTEYLVGTDAAAARSLHP